jgi:hypothetical protein
MLPWLLNRSVFLSLRDMGFPLPDYTEIPVPIAMAPEQANRYEDLKEQLKEELKERLVRGDKSLLAGYLYALLFWPDSPRRAKVVTCPRTGEVVASIPALHQEFISPKEEAIIERCLAEKADGRRVLLFCLQTDTLDIQPEWKEMLEAVGLKAAILRASPSKREKWVEKQVKAGVDVIITHPRKVETGIDLLDFPSLKWMATDYSVYTVLQASRRSWRIGQTQPVDVRFYAYEGTIQEDALHLVAAKVAAALRVNGDVVGGDTLADLDDLTSGDLVATLAKIVIGETRIEAHSLQQAFAEANASLRQADTIIGEYSIIDDGEDEEPEPTLATIAKQPVLSGSTELSLPKEPLSVVSGDVQPANGHSRQPSLFSNGQVPMNGKTAVITLNGNGQHTNNGIPEQQKEGLSSPNGKPPVPRPRLLIG